MIHSGFCTAAPERCSEGCQHDKEEDRSHILHHHTAAGTLAGKGVQELLVTSNQKKTKHQKKLIHTSTNVSPIHVELVIEPTSLSNPTSNPTGSRSSDLTGLCRPEVWHGNFISLLKRETEHLCFRQPRHTNTFLFFPPDRSGDRSRYPFSKIIVAGGDS